MLELDHEPVAITRTLVSAEEPSGHAKGPWRYFQRDGLTWEHFVGERCAARPKGVLLTAPSGSGKTTEVFRLAQKLREDHEAVLLCDAKLIADRGLEAGLDKSELDVLHEWRKATSHLTVIVDAADEVYLRRNTFADLAREIGRSIELQHGRVQLVLTARADSWRSSDMHTFKALLRRTGSEKPDVRHLTFAPLTLEAVKALAVSFGATDVESFVREFERKEIDQLVDFRPLDVGMLTSYWQAHGAFDAWTRILRWFVEASYGERNPSRRLHGTLTREDYFTGLRRVAAAMVLGRQSHVMLPGESSVPGTLHSSELFPEWSESRTSEFFTSPLFVSKGESAVQLQAGMLPEFLTATWLAQRHARGAAIEDIQRVVIVAPPGHRVAVVPESRWPLAGWLASHVAETGRSIAKVCPHAVLYEGDPAAHELDVLAFALEQLAKQKTSPSFYWPTRATLESVARPGLERAVTRLLLRNDVNEHAKRRLIQLAEVGCYSQCAQTILRVALKDGVQSSLRAAAISAVGVIGTPVQKRQLLRMTSRAPTKLRPALYGALVPDTLCGQDLVQFLKGPVEDLALVAEKTVFPLTSAQKLAVADDFLARLRGAPRSPRRSPQHTSKEALVNLALELVVSRVLDGNPNPAMSFAQLVFEAEKLHSDVYIPEHRIERVRAAISTTRLWKAVWEMKVSSPDFYAATDSHVLTPLNADVVAWLAGCIRRKRHASDRRTLESLIVRAYARADASGRADLIRRFSKNRRVATLFVRLEKDWVQHEAERRSAAETQTRKVKRVRQKYRAQLRPIKGQIQRGAHAPMLGRAWSHLEGTDRARIDFGKLEELVGSDYAGIFAKGLQAYWRRCNVGAPPTSGGTPTVTFAALTGVTLELVDAAKIAGLTPADAAQAARLAMHELNAFPLWFAKLLSTHEAAVLPVLEETIGREWDADVEHHGVLRFAPYEDDERVRKVVGNIAALLLEQRTPRHPTGLHHAASALLASGRWHESFTAICRSGSASGAVAKVRAEWLRLWTHNSPLEASAWVTAELQTSVGFEAVVEHLAEMFERDCDERFGRVQSKLMEPDALASWAAVLFKVVDPRRDPRRDAPHAVGRRENAEQFRSRCLRALSAHGGLESLKHLRALARRHDLSAHRKTFRSAIDDHLGAAAERLATVWTPSQILQVERGDARVPSSDRDLFHVVRGHLARVAELVERDEFSYQELFNARVSEKTVQRWVASSLKLVSRGLYSVVRENELRHDKRVDISAFRPSVGRVPIEIKPVGRYSLLDLKRCIDEQLVSKYMHQNDVNYGVLLVVLLRSKEWSGNLDTAAALKELAAYADSFAIARGKVVSVECIDFARARKPRAVARKTSLR